MHIEARIPCAGGGVATFDPQKVIERAAEFFETLVADRVDYSDLEVQQVMTSLEERGVASELRSQMISQIKGKAARTGPTYKFRLRSRSGAEIQGMARRYSVTLSAEGSLTLDDQQHVARFLESLELGYVVSDTQTVVFPDRHPEDWLEGYALARDLQRLAAAQDMMDHADSNEAQSIWFRLTNPGELDVTLRLEPWGEEYTLVSGAQARIQLRGPRGDSFEVEHTPDRITIYGWPGSVIEITGPRIG